MEYTICGTDLELNVFNDNLTEVHLQDISSIEIVEDFDNPKLVEVYDLSVEEHETFIAGVEEFDGSLQGVLVHNSAMYPSIGQTFNLSPNTYIMKIDIDTKTISRWLYEGYLSDEDANREVNIVYKPMTWFGEEGKLGLHQTDKLGNVFNWVKDNEYILTAAGAVLYNHDQKLGFHTELLTELREQRNIYRKLEKEAAEAGDGIAKAKHNKAQLARKLVMNGGYYGSQGTDSYSFFSIGLAESITKSAKVEISYVCYALEDYIIKCEDKARELALLQDTENDFYDIIDDETL